MPLLKYLNYTKYTCIYGLPPMGVIDISMALILLSACDILMVACVKEVSWELNVAV